MRNLIGLVFILLLVPSLHLYAGNAAHAQKTVYFCNDPDWYPVDYTDRQGHPKGIAVDILKWLVKNELTQYRLVHWPTRTWEESLKAFRQNKCQILAEAIRTPKRERFMLFTQPLMEYPVIFVTEKTAPPIFNLTDLKGKTLARRKGSALITALKRRIPELKVLETPDTSSAYLAVAGGTADFTADIAPVVHGMIQRLSLTGLKPNGKSGLSYDLPIAINKAYPGLAKQLDAAITRMPLAERIKIQAYYIPNTRETPPSVETESWSDILRLFATQNLMQLIGIITLLIITLLAWLLYRQRRVTQNIALDALTKLPTRHMLTEQVPKLLKKAGKGKMPLSVITLDVDFFKSVNDTFGHNMGDEVLKRVAKVLFQSKRDADLLARWGGEEFVLVSPGADMKRACALAERMRENIADTFIRQPELPNITISLGVAQYQPGETFEQVIDRADKALYRAKRTGRNRVCCDASDMAAPSEPAPFVSPYKEQKAVDDSVHKKTNLLE